MSSGTWERLYSQSTDEKLLDYSPEPWVVETALRVHPNGLWLDAGSGDGRHADAIASPSRPVVAVDAAISSGRRDVVASVDQLPFSDEAFGLVVCADVLSVLERPTQALRELARVCRADGHVIVTVQTHDDETSEWGELLGRRDESWVRRRLGPYDVTFYTSLGVDGLVASAGMRVLAREYYDRHDGPHPHLQVGHRHSLCGLLLRPMKNE